jgi:hypothetical protein
MGGTWNVSQGTNARVWGGMGGAIVIAAIWAIMVVWLADRWLIAAATLALIAVPCDVLVLPGAAVRAVVCVMVVTV